MGGGSGGGDVPGGGGGSGAVAGSGGGGISLFLEKVKYVSVTCGISIFFQEKVKYGGGGVSEIFHFSGYFTLLAISLFWRKSEIGKVKSEN